MKNHDLLPQKVVDIDWSFLISLELLSKYKFNTILDVGSGSGHHSLIFKHLNKQVLSIDKYNPSDYSGDILAFNHDNKFDCIFISHVIEHQRNVGLFLDKIYDLLDENGILVISGPTHNPLKLIEGHLTTCHLPLLLQNLILSGFSLVNMPVYSISGFETGLIAVKNKSFDFKTRMDSGYIFQYKEHWPETPTQGSMVYNKQVYAKNMSVPVEMRSQDISKPNPNKFYKINLPNDNQYYSLGISCRRFSDWMVIV